MMIEVLLYQRKDGRFPFEDWFDVLDPQAAAKVTIAVERLRRGHVSNLKGVGAGVQEYRIDWGPGYRLYIGRDGETLVILLTGGTKRHQASDIVTAKDIGLTTNSGKRKMTVAKSFKSTVEARLARDPSFREACCARASTPC